MPRDLARLVKDARHGRMRVDLDLKRLDSCGHRLHSAMNRATIGIMTASLVVGSSIVMTVAEGPTLLGVPLLTFFGDAVGTPITERPPHRTVRAAFPHTAPTSGV
jgi:ubiquinone biosynthesis protein